MNAKSLKRLFSYLKGSAVLVVLSVIIGLLFGGSTVAIPYFAGRAIDDLAVKRFYFTLWYHKFIRKR